MYTAPPTDVTLDSPSRFVRASLLLMTTCPPTEVRLDNPSMLVKAALAWMVSLTPTDVRQDRSSRSVTHPCPPISKPPETLSHEATSSISVLLWMS